MKWTYSSHKAIVEILVTLYITGALLCINSYLTNAQIITS